MSGFHNAWRDAAREIDAGCTLVDLLTRHVAHTVSIEVTTQYCGQLCATATIRGTQRRTHYPQGMLPDDEFPIFAARHIEAFARARMRRAA